MANNSFRDSVNSLGWSRRDPDLPVHTGSTSNTPFLSRLQSYNPFGDGGYVQLPTHNEAPGAPLPAPNRRDEEEGFFACKFRPLGLVTTSDLQIVPHTVLLDPGDGNAVPAPGGFSIMLVYGVASRQEEMETKIKATSLTHITYSKPMGPHAHFWCMQLGRRRLFHDLLLFVPRLVVKAPQIRRPVSCHRPWAAPPWLLVSPSHHILSPTPPLSFSTFLYHRSSTQIPSW